MLASTIQISNNNPTTRTRPASHEATPRPRRHHHPPRNSRGGQRPQHARHPNNSGTPTRQALMSQNPNSVPPPPAATQHPTPTTRTRHQTTPHAPDHVPEKAQSTADHTRGGEVDGF